MLRVLGWLVLIGLALEHWPVVVGVVVVVLTVKVLALYCEGRQEVIAAQRAAEARLIANADREHALVQQGNVDGVYGSYPVPRDLRGVGIWLPDSLAIK